MDRVAALTRERFAWQDDHGAAITADVVEQVQRCRDRWELALEGAFTEGVGPPVLWGTAGKRPVVLKIGWEPDFRQQCRTLIIAAGRGYVEVLAHQDGTDEGLPDALLLERLGPPLGERTRSPEQQLGILGELLPVAWEATAGSDAAAGSSKADGLRQVLVDLAQLAPGYDRVLASADALAATLTARGRHPVVVHGDPHPGNALRREDGAWVFVDPDGFKCDAAYDLGVTVRGWNDQLAAIAEGDGVVAVRSRVDEWCQIVAQGTGVDPELVRDWSFVERVTTGLWLIRLGYTEEGRGYLATADLLR